jgi:hypothetical protein
MYTEERRKGYEAKERADGFWRAKEMARVLWGWREYAATAPIIRWARLS